MPSKRPLSNKVGVPDAEVMQPHPHLPANHLSPRGGEFEGGCGELLSWYTLGFHHLRFVLVAIPIVVVGQ